MNKTYKAHLKLSVVGLGLLQALSAHADWSSPSAGQQVMTIDSLKNVTVVFVQDDGLYAVNDNGHVYGNVDPRNLAVETGCGGLFCISDQVTFIDQNSLVTVIALQNDGSYMVQDASGAIFSSISAASLAPIVVAPPVQAPITKITSLNGEYNPSHATEMWVHPGDVITLSADLLDSGNNNQALGDSVEDFVWTAIDRSGDRTKDRCDAANNENCLAYSNFQATDYGVTYYVPYTMGDYVQLNVVSHNAAAIDGDYNASQDTITLRNAGGPAYQAPVALITSAAEYHADRLDANIALAGHGQWVWINGVRYFTPHTYAAHEAEWAPYHNGYWSWDNNYGWTWISYDPWGWVTDHHGVWRYHGVYGWIWMPFEDLHYEAHTVTWFHDGEHIGWYPYHANYKAGYVHGYNEGFRDGFEEGVRASRHISEPQYHGGFTVVRREDVTNVNIVKVTNITVINRTTVINIVNNSSTHNTFNNYPGGSQSGARSFVEQRASAPAPITHTSMPANGKFVHAEPVHPVPEVYQTVARSNVIGARPVAIGTVIKVDPQHPTQEAQKIPPTANGKSIVAAPQAHDAGGKILVLPARSSAPAQPKQDNPLTQNKPVQHPSAPGTNVHTALPTFDATKPAPAPVTARPNPITAAPVVASKPLPAPVVAQKPIAAPKPVATIPTTHTPVTPTTPVVHPPMVLPTKPGTTTPVAPHPGPVAPTVPGTTTVPPTHTGTTNPPAPVTPVTPHTGPVAPTVPGTTIVPPTHTGTTNPPAPVTPVTPHTGTVAPTVPGTTIVPPTHTGTTNPPAPVTPVTPHTGNVAPTVPGTTTVPPTHTGTTTPPAPATTIPPKPTTTAPAAPVVHPPMALPPTETPKPATPVAPVVHTAPPAPAPAAPVVHTAPPAPAPAAPVVHTAPPAPAPAAPVVHTAPPAPAPAAPVVHTAPPAPPAPAPHAAAPPAAAKPATPHH